MNGIDGISQAFSRAQAQGRAALMPYYTLGYPTLADTPRVVKALAEAGADLIELGVPFSDPLADGPTIQHSTQVALENGMSVARCFEQVRAIRAAGITLPLLLMGYINPVLAYGVERYVQDCNEAGVNGLILPDLPLEEAGMVEALCREAGLALVYLATAGSSAERLRELADHTSGFLYLVSLNGVTGARESLPEGLEQFVRHAQSACRTPVAVGFGIATPQQAAAVGRAADGVIIGSALIQAVGGAADPAAAAYAYLRPVREGLVTA